VHTFSATLFSAGSQKVTVTDTANSVTTGSATVAVNPAAASHFTVSTPSAASAGAPFSVTVAAFDPFNNLATGYRGTIHFTSSDAAAGLPGNYPFTAADNGSHTFTGGVTLNTTGNQTVTVTDTTTTSITGTSGTIAVNVATVTHFSVSAPGTSTAGAPFSVTVTALDTNGNPVPGYRGTIHFTSSDAAAGLPGNYTFTAADNGSHTFTGGVTLVTAGNQTVTATDTTSSSITGTSGTVAVSAAAASKLVFGQQPSNVAVGATITPAVTVRVLDTFGNLVSSDNTDQVTVALGSNPGSGTLGGTTTVTVSGGVATFSGLSINNAGTGYTLTAASGSLTGATSASFNVTTSSSNVIEDFETTETWFLTGSGNVVASRTTAAAHDGTFGLDMATGNDWIYRNDAGSQVKAGDTLSVWLRFSGSANGRAYFGFGSTATGTLSIVAAPNTGQLILQENLAYNFTNLAAVRQSYLRNHWYRLEVDWGTSGKIIGKLFDSNGTTLLNQVTAATTDITAGGIAFRATGNDKFFDTVTDTRGVNNFGVAAPPGPLLAANLAGAGLGTFSGGEQASSAWTPGRSSQILISIPAGMPSVQTAVGPVLSGGSGLGGFGAWSEWWTTPPRRGTEGWSEWLWMLEG
jgi:hypothetical protein